VSPSRRAWPALAAVAVGLLLAAGAAGQDGARGLGSALLGVALVVGFLASGVLPVLVVRSGEVPAGAGAGLLLLTYTLRLAVAVAVLRVAARSEAVDPRWTAATVIAGALAWVLGQGAAVLVRPPRHDLPGHGPGAGA
jgi:hypothetical protein